VNCVRAKRLVLVADEIVVNHKHDLNAARRNASSSAKTCSLFLRRGLRPKVITMMSQNSQVNGRGKSVGYRTVPIDFHKSIRGSGNTWQPCGLIPDMTCLIGPCRLRPSPETPEPQGP
jgi:hypothetical protein